MSICSYMQRQFNKVVGLGAISHPLRSVEHITKTPMTCIELLTQGAQETPKTIQVIIVAPDCFPELDSKNLLLNTPHTLDMGLEESNWNSVWLGFPRVEPTMILFVEELQCCPRTDWLIFCSCHNYSAHIQVSRICLWPSAAWCLQCFKFWFQYK